MGKAKFSKRKCRKCKWHGAGVGYRLKEDGQHLLIHCNYSGYHESTPLRCINGKVIDLRGEDRYNCQLFEKGVPESKKQDFGGNIYASESK